jgi:hypothetical protein
MARQIEGASSLIVSRGQLEPVPRWRLATRIAFRFCLVYFSLYVLLTQILSTLLTSLWFRVFELGTRAPMRPLIFWVARSLFHIDHALVTLIGSGDKTFNWVEALCILTNRGLILARRQAVGCVRATLVRPPGGALTPNSGKWTCPYCRAEHPHDFGGPLFWIAERGASRRHALTRER